MHVASGVSGLVTTVLLGNRRGFGLEVFRPYNILLTAVGCCLLWVGWFGFNGGSGGTAGRKYVCMYAVERHGLKLLDVYV